MVAEVLRRELVDVCANSLDCFAFKLLVDPCVFDRVVDDVFVRCKFREELVLAFYRSVEVI